LTEKSYLRRDVMIEPLIDRCCGWFHLIPPATVESTKLVAECRSKGIESDRRYQTMELTLS
jgi:hypothetical protein